MPFRRDRSPYHAAAAPHPSRPRDDPRLRLAERGNSQDADHERQRLGIVEIALTVTLPCAAPYVLTGVKLAVAYSLIGVIGAEFIMSRGGMGYEISFAYTNFDNATMYPLILLILAVSIAINAALSRWEKVLLGRRGQ